MSGQQSSNASKSAPIYVAAAAMAAVAGGALVWRLQGSVMKQNNLDGQKPSPQTAIGDVEHQLGLLEARVQQLQAQLAAAQGRQVVLNIPVQDSAEALTSLETRLEESQAEVATLNGVINQYQQAEPDLVRREATFQAEQEQLRRERAALRARETVFAQRSTEQASAVTAEEAGLVEQARGLDLQRVELKDAEAALQAQRTRAQQEYEQQQQTLQKREHALAQCQTDHATAVTAEEEMLVGQARELDLQRAELKSAEEALQAQHTQVLKEHEKEQHELHAREGALAQRQADQAKAAAAEQERLVGKAREVDLGRGELREAEVALQAQRAQAQQEYEQQQQTLQAKGDALAQRQRDQASAATAEGDRLLERAKEVDLSRAELKTAEEALQAQHTQVLKERQAAERVKEQLANQVNDWVQNPRVLRGEVSGEDAATKWERIRSRGTALKTREQELDEREAALSKREASTDRRQAGLDAWQLKVQADIKKAQVVFAAREAAVVMGEEQQSADKARLAALEEKLQDMLEAKVKECDNTVQLSKRQALAAEAAMQNTQQQLQKEQQSSAAALQEQVDKHAGELQREQQRAAVLTASVAQLKAQAKIDGQGWGPSTPPTPSAAHTPINASLSPTSNSSGDLNTTRGGNNSSRSSRLAPPHFAGSGAAGKPSCGATPGPVVGSRAGSVSGSSSGTGGLSDTMLRRLTMPDGRPFAAQPAQLSGLRKAHTPPPTSGSTDSSSHSRVSRAAVQIPSQQQQPGFHLADDAPPGFQALAPISNQRGLQQGDRISTGAAQPQQQQHPAERNGGGHHDRTAQHRRGPHDRSRGGRTRQPSRR